MKKISHEVPISLLEESRSFNHYEYCLCHLLESYPQYSQFFRDSLKMGREVVLDNSIFELGVSFDAEKFASIVSDLQPTYYIIPDVLEDCEGTVKNLRSWVTKYSDLPGKKIGVVQGKTYEELVYCYEEVDKFCDMIAISFDYSCYEKLSPSKSKFVSWMYGRQKLLSRLLSDGVINEHKQHHLLGCASINEYKAYKSKYYNFIYSLDTSNPIVYGLLGMKYSEENLFLKPKIKLCDLIEANPSPEQRESILHNVNLFKTYVNA